MTMTAVEDFAVRCDMGEMYMDSDDEKEQRHGVEIIGNLAIEGYSQAQVVLGLMYMNGEHVPQNNEKALKWFQKADDQGDANALIGMAFLYGDNLGDNDKAFMFLQKAAERGNKHGQYLLAVAYQSGMWGISEDIHEAEKWYKKAAQQDNNMARYRLGRIYVENDDMGYDTQDGIKLIEKAAREGDGDAQDYLGSCYHYGFLLKKDINKAWNFYTQAAGSGVANSMIELGVMNLNREKMAPNDAAAIYYLKAALDKGDSRANYYLGRAYLDGRGVDEDGDKGWDLIESAADDGFELALNFLGKTYLSMARDEETDDKDREEYVENAAHYLSQSAEQNNAEGQWHLGWMYINGDYFDKDEHAGIDLFKKAADQDFSPAMVALGMCFEDGIGVPQDKNTAISYYEMAAEQDNEEAIEALKRLR